MRLAADRSVYVNSAAAPELVGSRPGALRIYKGVHNFRSVTMDHGPRPGRIYNMRDLCSRKAWRFLSLS